MDGIRAAASSPTLPAPDRATTKSAFAKAAGMSWNEWQHFSSRRRAANSFTKLLLRCPDWCTIRMGLFPDRIAANSRLQPGSVIVRRGCRR